MNSYDLIGIGIGPFNLSLAALLDKTNLKTLFFERKKEFKWHSELMFEDASMQTHYLKDLVTSVDPTSPYSFLNYLVRNGLFHHFMNTERNHISRKEFELYCQWVSQKLEGKLQFSSEIKEVRLKNQEFKVFAGDQSFRTQNISVATGPIPHAPECTQGFLGSQVFHAKSPYLNQAQLSEKNVVIIGGGQSGVEIFKNALKNRWGKPNSLKLISQRSNLLPLDESPFANEYFTPTYVNDFFNLPIERKKQIVDEQEMTSDGITPSYLLDLYRDLYQIKIVERDQREVQILPRRELFDMSQIGSSFTLALKNEFLQETELLQADIVILATGFKTKIPECLSSILDFVPLNEESLFNLDDQFRVNWEYKKTNTIYALNFGRQQIGISEPQTSLMAWRSARIINSMMSEEIYKIESQTNFSQFSSNDQSSIRVPINRFLQSI